MMTHSDRFARWLPLALLLTGSLIFIGGGSFHPHANDTLGPLGSDEFYLRFTQVIEHTPGWAAMHTMILVGPLFWALAAPAIRGRLPRGGDSMWSVGQTALLLGAGLWAVCFVFDGFVAPVFARSMAQAGAPPDLSALTMFKGNQQVVIRLGLISWILNGIAMAIFAGGLFARAQRSTAAVIVAAAGIAIGIWPIIAALTGEFIPGPFTSHLWKQTALATAFWYVAFGVMLARQTSTAKDLPVSS